MNQPFTRDNVLQLWGHNTIIKDLHEGVAQGMRSKVMVSHKNKDSTYSKVPGRFFRQLIYKDVETYNRFCENCHKQGNLKK